LGLLATPSKKLGLVDFDDVGAFDKEKGTFLRSYQA